MDKERLLDSFRYLCNTDTINKQLSKQDVNEVRSILKQIQTPAHVNMDPNQPMTRPLPKFTDRLNEKLDVD